MAPLSCSSSLEKRLHTVPVHCAVLMGFGPAAGFAQGMTDATTAAAHLPEQQRVVRDRLCPEALPVWGSIIDDVWAVEEVPASNGEYIGPQWLTGVDDAWYAFGVESHPKKKTNAEAGGEIQGYHVSARSHQVGVALAKRLGWTFFSPLFG